jgi:hypothetical protein
MASSRSSHVRKQQTCQWPLRTHATHACDACDLVMHACECDAVDSTLLAIQPFAITVVLRDFAIYELCI